MRKRRFKRHHVLDQDVEHRLRQIEYLSTTAKWVPRTTFSSDSEVLIQYQEWITVSKSIPTFDHVCQLATQMDADLNFVHGDLCRKKLIFDGNQLWVVDWEPSLRQIKYGVPQFMATKPYLAMEVRKNHVLTRKTDIISFFFTALKIVYPDKVLHNKAEWSRVRKIRNIAMTPICEDAMNQLSNAIAIPRVRYQSLNVIQNRRATVCRRPYLSCCALTGIHSLHCPENEGFLHTMNAIGY